MQKQKQMQQKQKKNQQQKKEKQNQQQKKQKQNQQQKSTIKKYKTENVTNFYCIYCRELYSDPPEET